MSKNELKKLRRSQLLQLLLESEEENEKLRREAKEYQEKLQDRTIAIEKCGSLAEASLELNAVFASTQAACQQYLDNIKSRQEYTEEKCREMERESAARCLQTERETKEKCREQEMQASEKCAKMIANIRERCDQYWNIISGEIGLEKHPEEGKIG